jgi:hypothetical protein
MGVGTHAEAWRQTFAHSFSEAFSEAFPEAFPETFPEGRDAWRVSLGGVERLDERTRNANGFCRGLVLVHDGIRGSWRKATWPS